MNYFDRMTSPGAIRSWGKGALLLLALTVALPACNSDDDDVDPGTLLIEPTGPPQAWGPTIDPQMLAVIEEFQRFGTPPLPDLSPRQARMAPSVTDAVNSLLSKNNQQVPAINVTTSQQVIPTTLPAAPDGLLVRIYKPVGAAGQLPVIVYYHGGGWVIGSLDVYEPSAKALAANVGAIVVSVDYRLSPEAKFPAAHEDAFAAYKWVRENAASMGGNPAKIAVAGESAGGNMAVGVCLLARERNVPQPVHQLLVYPVANNDLTTESYNTYANAVPLSRANIEYFTKNYFNTPADGNNPLISLTDMADLRNLPPATIIAAQIDPLQTEGKQLADRFLAAGVSATYQLYEGTTHEFFGTYAVVPKAGEAQIFAADKLRAAFQ